LASPIASGALTRYLERLLAVCALAAAVVFISIGIGRSLWLDEANSVLIASHGFSGIVDALSRDNNLPFYYFVLSVWIRWFGDSEIALRSLSALFYLGGCAAVFALGRRLTGEIRAAWYCAWFYEVSSLAFRQAQNIRMYALLGMLSALSTWCWLRVFRDRDDSRRAWTWFLAVNAIGLLTHVWFVFVLIGQFVATALFERRQLGRFILGVFAAGVPFALLWSPFFWGQLHNGATSWMPRFFPGLVIVALLEFYGPLLTPLFFAMALVSGGIAGLRKCKPAAALLAVFAAGVAVPLVVSAFKPIYWPGRYLIIALPPLAAVLGSIMAAFPLRPLAAGIGLLVLFAQVATHVAARDQMPDGQLPPGQSDRTTAEFLLAHASAGDAAVFTSLTRAAADYYFHRAGAAARFHEFSFPADTAIHPGWMDPSVSPARRPLLEAEAVTLSAGLRGLAARGATVWVYDGSAVNLNRILTPQLDLTLTLHASHPLEGPYHKRLLEYGAAAPGAALPGPAAVGEQHGNIERPNLSHSMPEHPKLSYRKPLKILSFP
jgi:hypothetical protein